MASGLSKRRGEDEKTLVMRAIDGDADAFGELYTRHMDAIYRYVYFRVGDEREAEDLTEEVFVRAWTALPKYRPSKHPFTSWLYRIAHNLVVDYHRKQKPVDLPDQPELRWQANAAPGSTEDQVALRQDVAELIKAVRQLDEKEQLIVVLRFVEGLSHKEVAKIIGKSEVHCRVLQHRVLAKLQEYLDDGKEA